MVDDRKDTIRPDSERGREGIRADMNPAEMLLRLVRCSRLSEDQRRLVECYARTMTGNVLEES